MQNWMKWLIWIAAIIASLLIIPLLTPMETYKKQAETLLAKALGSPVHIGTLRIAFLPSPRLNADDIKLGAENELSAERLSVVPALSSLFSEKKVISSITIEKPVIKKAAMDIFANFSKQPKNTSSNMNISVRQINIEEAKLIWPGFQAPNINANVILSAENMPKAAKIENTAGNLKLNLVSEGMQQRITFTASAWTLPVGPPLLINALFMEMVLTDKKLEISKIDSSLYGGKLTGAANLTWGNIYKLSGNIKLNDLAVSEPARLMSKSTNVSGQLFSQGAFNANAKEASKLIDNLNANIQFNVKDGVLYGFDLAKAPLMLIGQGKGGETKFDEFSGILGITAKTYKFRNLNIKSGLMSADGTVTIRSDKSLNGEVEVEAKNSMKIASIPLEVSGTLESPKVFPTKTAIAGAVAGTAVLGPAGTGLGLKAGKAVDKLKGFFGKN
ncbi:MAG: AsmA-like C-terminal region-containing protein [Methylophilaceae bacterium]